MSFIDRLERRFPKLAIEGLIRYLSFLMLTVFVLNQSGHLSFYWLTLDSTMVMRGEVWRLLTFLLIPYSRSFIFLLFELMILVKCADALEHQWGTFKLCIYYYCGALACILLSFVVPGTSQGSYFIYLSFFLAFATINPDYELLIFFILPIKVKYLAALSLILILLQLVFAPLPLKLAALLSIANYLLFFSKKAYLKILHNRRQTIRFAEFEKQMSSAKEYHNKCSTCGKTNLSSPEEEFRFCTCTSCMPDGKEFCKEHLIEHKRKIGTFDEK